MRIWAYLLVVCVLLTSGFQTFAESPAAGKQVEQVLEYDDGSKLEYQLFLPADYDSSNPHALLLFLHGRGESYGPLSLVKKWGPPRIVETGTKLPFIVVSPQCPGKPARWNDETRLNQLSKLLDHLDGELSVDKTRMYLTGLSMGGEGVWALSAKLPGKFAALAPVCGATEPAQAKHFLDVPIWIWHGTEDTAVPLTESLDMVQAIRKLGGEKVSITTLEHVGHNSWSAAYGTPQLYSWFRKHSTNKRTD